MKGCEKNVKEKRIGKSYHILLVIFFFLFFIPSVYAVQDQAGWPKTLGDSVLSSPALADLDGDGDFEVVIGSKNGTVYVWHGDGSLAVGWPKSISYSILSSPAVGDLDGDDDLEIVAISTQTGVNVPKSTIYAWHHDGTLIWYKPIDAGVVSSPALGDLDGDGDLEVVVGAEDNNVYAWHYDGSAVAGWPKTIGGKIYNSPALADLDGDGDLEIVAGSEDGNTYAWHHDGTLYWSSATGSIYVSSPAIADLDGDGELEIVIGSANGLYALNHDGTLLWSNDIEYSSSPALGDVDGDGDFEIVVGTNHLAPNHVYVLYNDGTIMWSNELRYYQLVEYLERVGSSPAIGDIDGDGSVEIIVATTVNNANLESGRLYTWNSDGTLAWYQDINGITSYIIASSPAIGDIDGDGDVEVVVGSMDGKVHAWDLSGAYDPDNIKWGMFRHDARHMGTLVLNNMLDIVQAQTDETTYIKNDNVIISAKVLDYYGIRTSADSVNAIVKKPDGSSETVVLQENTFGDYMGIFTDTLQTGHYTVIIYADRGGYKNATASLTFGVSSPPVWHYRIPINVDTGAYERTDVPIKVEINFTQKLQELGTTGTFDSNSSRVFETDAARNDLQEVPSQFEKKTGEVGTTNIALGKTATASSEYSSSYSASNAVDGSTGTLWIGTRNHNDWLKVDLGESAFISKVVVSGYSSAYCPRDFTIQVSTDDVEYTTVVTVVGNSLATSTHTFTPTLGRYVKLVVTYNNGYPWTYLAEFEIYPAVGAVYDASTNAVGDVKWIMNGTTPAGTSRYYNLYFDILENGTKSVPDYGVDYSALTMPDGITVTQGQTEVIEATNEPPTASIISPASGTVYSQKDTAVFDGTGTDTDGLIVSYEWTSSIDGLLSDSASFNTSNLSVGVHTITLTDNDGATGTASATINQTEYDVEWLMQKTTFRPGSTAPIKFTVHSPITGGFVIDDSVVVKVYDPDMNGVFRATYAEEKVRIDAAGKQYITDFRLPKDAPTGTYAIKVEFASAPDKFETTIDIHTRVSKIVDTVLNKIKSILRRWTW